MTRMMIIGRWVRYALVAALGALAVVLIVTTIVSGPPAISTPQPAGTPEAAEPAVAAASPTPTPSPSPLPSEPERRFLALDGGGVLWRGTAGSCAEGIAPKLERTADAVVWRTATPPDAAQLLALTPGDARDQARVVIALDDGSCAVAERGTAPDGQSWEEPVGAAFEAEAPAPDVLATTPADVLDSVITAMRLDGCEGVHFTTEGAGFDAVTLCETTLDPADPIAIDYADGRLYVWSGDVVTAIDMSRELSGE